MKTHLGHDTPSKSRLYSTLSSSSKRFERLCPCSFLATISLSLDALSRMASLDVDGKELVLMGRIQGKDAQLPGLIRFV